jgi:large subunit ribosomal protein L30
MPEKKAKTAKRATKTKTKATKKKTTKTKTKTKATKRSTTKKATKRAAPKSPEPAATGRVRVKQVRSGIGHADTFRRTLRAIGLKHHQDEVVVPNNPSVQGMLFKVRHLVQVTPEEA